MEQGTLFDMVSELQILLTKRATGVVSEEEKARYEELRGELTANNTTKLLLPKFVLHCRNLDQFWNFIQPKFNTYRERRTFIFEAFTEPMNQLEGFIIMDKPIRSLTK